MELAPATPTDPSDLRAWAEFLSVPTKGEGRTAMDLRRAVAALFFPSLQCAQRFCDRRSVVEGVMGNRILGSEAPKLG